jgi:hypothetical protein
VYRILLCVGLLFAMPAFAEVEVPQLTLYDMEGESDIFPQNQNMLVFLGFQQKAKDELLLWQKALLQKQIPIIMIAVFPSYMSWGVTREPLIALCRKIVPLQALPSFRIAFYDKEKLINQLGLSPGKETLEHIHVFYLEGSKVRWSASRTPSPELLAQLKVVMEDQEA